MLENKTSAQKEKELRKLKKHLSEKSTQDDPKKRVTVAKAIIDFLKGLSLKS